MNICETGCYTSLFLKSFVFLVYADPPEKDPLNIFSLKLIKIFLIQKNIIFINTVYPELNGQVLSSIILKVGRQVKGQYGPDSDPFSTLLWPQLL